MVRINLILPELLSYQHLIAEKNEIGLLCGYIRKYPSFVENDIPLKFTLNKGHIIFFKNKVYYLKKRYKAIRIEIKKRGFTMGINLDWSVYNNTHLNDWEPNKDDYELIIKRISERLIKKPNWYRYHSEYLDTSKVKIMIKTMNTVYLL